MKKNAVILFIIFVIIIFSQSCKRFNPPSSPLPGTATFTKTATRTATITYTPTATLTPRPCTACIEAAYIPDTVLVSYIKQAINKSTCTGPVCIEDLGAITSLSLGGVVDFTGLTLCSNLRYLAITQNARNAAPYVAFLSKVTHLALENSNMISADLAYISGMVNLTTLSLNTNLTITDISSLAGLTNLTTLAMDANQISSLVPLDNMTKLTILYVSNNLLTSLDGIGGLTNLNQIGVRSNNITDISSVSALIGLKTLDLHYNHIADISALTINASSGGMGGGSQVNLQSNPLNASPDTDTYIPYLRSRGVTVTYP